MPNANCLTRTWRPRMDFTSLWPKNVHGLIVTSVTLMSRNVTWERTSVQFVQWYLTQKRTRWPLSSTVLRVCATIGTTSPGSILGNWTDVSGFLESDESDRHWKVRLHGAWSNPHDAMDLRLHLAPPRLCWVAWHTTPTWETCSKDPLERTTVAAPLRQEKRTHQWYYDHFDITTVRRFPFFPADTCVSFKPFCWSFTYCMQDQPNTACSLHQKTKDIEGQWRSTILAKKEIMFYARIAFERHDSTATRADRLQEAKRWILHVNADGSQKLLRQRTEFAVVSIRCMTCCDPCILTGQMVSECSEVWYVLWFDWSDVLLRSSRVRDSSWIPLERVIIVFDQLGYFM